MYLQKPRIPSYPITDTQLPFHRAGGPADSIGAKGAVEESEPVVSGVADAAGELAAAGRATAAGVAASTEFKPRWGSSQEYWRTMASTPPLRQSSIWTGLLDEVALGVERIDPGARDDEIVLEQVEE